ncbi:unnamed protein product [Chrysoparadoxa australica]
MIGAVFKCLLLSLLLLLVAPLDGDLAVELAIQLYNSGQGDAELLGEQTLREVSEQYPSHPSARFLLGMMAQRRGDSPVAMASYRAALKLDPSNVDAYNNLAMEVERAQGDGWEQEAYNLFHGALDIDPGHRWALNNIGLLCLRTGRRHEALEWFARGLASVPGDAEIAFNQGVALQQLGMIQEAANSYGVAISARPDYVEARLNLAALHHGFGNMEDASEHYMETLRHITEGQGGDEMRIMIGNNLAGLLYQLGEVDLAEQRQQEVLSLIRGEQAGSSGTPGSPGSTDDMVVALVNLLRIRQKTCYWEDWQHMSEVIVRMVQAEQLGAGQLPSLLPFDTLLMSYPMDQALRLRIASAISDQWSDLAEGRARSTSRPKLPEPTHPPEKDPLNGTSSRTGDWITLNVGFLGFDYHDHPTAHMIEGLFAWQRRLVEESGSNIRYIAFNYGKQDNSSYRKAIEAGATKFVDLAAASHSAAADQLEKDSIHILVDLQGHTLGGRSQIAASRPAPIQVSYLTFPGSSGAPYIDWMLADKYVAPPEHAAHYSEKLLYMPHTYQVNTYSFLQDGDEEAGDTPLSLRSRHGLPEDAVVFVNFNKADKMEPESFTSWMRIMARVPGSVLWLLGSSKHRSKASVSRAHLAATAQACGVAPARLVWSEHVDKPRHIQRHLAGDIFLDTFTYGAHSTATDALKGGLPVISLAGDAFASRVRHSAPPGP